MCKIGLESCRFSVVIPAYNIGSLSVRAVKSIVEQDFSSYEIIVVDDNSTDETYAVLQDFAANGTIQLYRTEKNGGPGAARNIGINHAKGEYILFLDADDMYTPGFFSVLDKKLRESGNPDILGFDYSWMFNNPDIGARYDIDYLNMGKHDLLYHYLRMHMVGATIFNAYRRTLIVDKKLKFREGFHEDIDFAYKAFYYANTITGDSSIGYVKENRAGSIVNTVSRKHIDGYFDAYEEIAGVVPTDLVESFFAGLLNICVFKIKDILKLPLESERRELYTLVYDRYKKLCPRSFNCSERRRTSYEVLVDHFMQMMADGASVSRVDKAVTDDLGNTWGCWELFNSVFLAPDEIRTCCKRFFVDGKRRGDVPLVKTTVVTEGLLNEIVKSKRKLFNAINQGEKTECDGCPYLLFQNWNKERDFLKIKKISFEYHTCCNLKCAYCSEDFNGGKTPDYSVKELLQELIRHGCIESCDSIVWGGGEPTLDKNFDEMLMTVTEAGFSGIQRVITNAMVYSKAIDDLLSQNKICVTTSVDAGTEETFKIVRGKTGLAKVLGTLKKYAISNADRVIVKYILTQDNCSFAELDAFASRVKEYGIVDCSFQISSDFKQEAVPSSISVGAVYLYCLLKKCGAVCVYFDELARERFRYDETVVGECKSLLPDFDKYVVCSCDGGNYVLCGNYIQMKHLLEKSLFAKGAADIRLAAVYGGYVGQICCGKKIESLESIRSDEKVVVAASQGTRDIAGTLLKNGIPAENIVDKLVI